MYGVAIGCEDECGHGELRPRLRHRERPVCGQPLENRRPLDGGLTVELGEERIGGDTRLGMCPSIDRAGLERGPSALWAFGAEQLGDDREGGEVWRRAEL